MISKMRLFTTLAALICFGGTAVAQATAEPTSLGKFEAWEALTYKAGDSQVCYVFSAPIKSDATRKVKRDPTYFMITNWPGRKIKGQVSTIIGYPFKENSDVKLTVGERSFVLYPVGDMAWADSAATEKAIVGAMRSGASMVVSGVSQRGTETRDSYSLNGLSAALDKINSACD